MLLTTDQQQYLLKLAREAIGTALRTKRLITPTVDDSLLSTPLGTFVTLTQRGNLRGCIGFPEAVYPLYEAVIRGGVSAATQDPRFSPLTLIELPGIDIEISVLSPLTPATTDEIAIGTHGLVIEQGYSRGLLLPQVPVEWGWDRETYLRQICRKAGLPDNAWQQGAHLFTFTAEVFSEKQFRQGTPTPAS